jgi:hypothetical protein
MDREGLNARKPVQILPELPAVIDASQPAISGFWPGNWFGDCSKEAGVPGRAHGCG